ncbi:unnamed protein product [Rotaria sordida]|uniref:Peptidase M14 domain-containing protein n=1 Tax=Rotaria sordida TaxID=392033 RepID=A0A813XVR1_9BILA|nr:unnamed protein product [Rotaria sordida]
MTIGTNGNYAKSYANHQLWRLHVTNNEQIAKILAFNRIAHLHDINFWSKHFRIHEPIDIRVPPQAIDDFADFLTSNDRLWRKTRSKTSVANCYGADPNRNWDYDWCKSGSSHDPCDDTFCGEKAFSEIETAQVAKFIADQRGTIVNYINFHSYSQLWMSPWSYTTTSPAQFKLQDDGSIQAINALTAVHGTQYQHGSVAQIISPTSGSTIDWTYGIANVTFSYGVELRDTGEYGFLLPENQIIPSGEETMAGLEALLMYIDKHVYA